MLEVKVSHEVLEANVVLRCWEILNSVSYSNFPALAKSLNIPQKEMILSQFCTARYRNFTCPRVTQEICVKDEYEKDCQSSYLLPQAQNYYYYLYITINVYGILQTDKVTGTAKLTLSIIKPSFCAWWWIRGEKAFYFCFNIFSTFWNLNLNFSFLPFQLLTHTGTKFNLYFSIFRKCPLL